MLESGSSPRMVVGAGMWRIPMLLFDDERVRVGRMADAAAGAKEKTKKRPGRIVGVTFMGMMLAMA